VANAGASAPRPGDQSSGRELAATLRDVAARLMATIEGIDPEAWDRLRKPGEWSPGKDAEHVTDALTLHFARVCGALGLVHPEAPTIERAQLTASRTRDDILAALRVRSEQAATVIEAQTDVQLRIVDRTSRSVGEIIERPLIRHLDHHREEIERKLRARNRVPGNV